MRNFLTILLIVVASAAAAQGVNDAKYTGLKGMIRSEVKKACVAGSGLSEDPGTFSLAANGNVIVRLGGFNCQWEFVNHYYCGARACTTREYSVQGTKIRLVREYLE
ncbi:hypothetical protein [Nitratireductor sp. CH_MIT9313-5]|uniref:hypothetical protein n=1 Tax=Nitratireductor sp. CH_MIT9313-5 TaxID=3107764 RepID=UPI00300901EE